MACIKIYKKDMQKHNMDEQSMMAAIKAWRAEDPTGSRENNDEYPSDEWFAEYKGGRTFIADSESVRLYKTRYNTPQVFNSKEDAVVQYKQLANLFGQEKVYMYTDTKGQTTVGVYTLVENQPNLGGSDNKRDNIDVQNAQSLQPDVLPNLSFTNVRVDSSYPNLAGTNRSTGIITLQKASFTPEEVLNHFQGKGGARYADQKQAVLDRLTKEGWSLERITNLLTGNKEATSLLLLHELSHRAHKDSYNLKNYMSEEALAIETRATKEALEQLNSLVNTTPAVTDAGNVVAKGALKISESMENGVNTVRISPKDSKNQAAFVIRKHSNEPWEFAYEGLETVISDGVPQSTFPFRDSVKKQLFRQAVDMVPMGTQISVSHWDSMNGADSPLNLGEDFFATSGLSFIKKTEDAVPDSIFKKTKYTTADLHITEHTGGYAARTAANARRATVTLALAENFTTAGEKRTKTAAGASYIGVLLDGRTVEQLGEEVFNELKKKNYGFIPKNVKLNVAGNSISNLLGEQEAYDNLVTGILKYLLERGVTFTTVRSGGQSGIDEAGIKAAQNLGLNWEILAPARYRFRNRNGADIVGNKTAFVDRFNREYQLQEYKVEETPVSDRTVRRVYSITQLSNKEPFRSTKMISSYVSADNVPSPQEREAHLLKLLASEELGIGDRIVPDTEMSAGELIGTVKALRGLSRYRVYSADPIIAPSASFSEEELAEFKKAKFEFTDSNDIIIPTFSVGYSQYRLLLMQQERELLSSGLFRDNELRALAKGAILKLSEEVTRLNTEPRRAQQLFGNVEGYRGYALKDYTQMARVDILDPVKGVGLNTLLNIVVKEAIFNPVNNTEVAAGKTTFLTLKKMRKIYDNFDAFIRLGYESLAGLEQVSFVDGYRDEYGIADFAEPSEGEIFSQEDDQIIQEVYGSSAEHWQVGFRQVSAISSLSQQIKRKLGTLYNLDENGVVARNEFGMPETIDEGEAATKILAWTQNAQNIDDMISKLQQHLKSEPWLNQLVGEYHVEGKRANSKTQGILLDATHNDQFRSLFFSNFKKYFQMYAITFKDNNGKTIVKGLNTSGYVDNVLHGLEGQAAQAKNGALRIWDGEKGHFSSDFTRLKTQVLGEEESRTNPIPLVKTSLKGLLAGEEVTETSPATDAMLGKIAEAYNLLDMQTPTVEELRVVFPTAGDVLNFTNRLVYTVSSIEDSVENGQLHLFTAKKNARSNYKKLAEMIAPIMGTNIEAVSYENGKLHYGYVTPSYMGMLFSKLRGNVENYDEFIQQEYGRYIGWFFTPQVNAPKGLISANPWLDPNESNTGWLNWWLELLSADTNEAKKDREKLLHVVSLSDDKVGYSDKSDAQFVSSLLSMYFYDGNKVNAYFAVPTLSNKESEEYIRFRRISEDYEDFITHQLVSKTFIQEVNRIRTVRNRLSRLSEQEKIANFDKESRGGHFQFLDFLNRFLDHKNSGKGNATDKFSAALQKFISGEEMNEDNFSAQLGTIVYTSELQYFVDALPQVIKKEMNKNFTSWVEKLKDQGFLTINNLQIDLRGTVTGSVENIYKISNKIGTGSEALENLKEFFWNDFFGSLNILQLTIGDLAMYKDTEDVQKRLAQLHSPGLRGNIFARDISNPRKRVSDGFTRTIYLADSVNPSQILPNLKVLHEQLLSNPKYVDESGHLNSLGKAYKSFLNDITKAFEKTNWADAQGLTSPTAYRKKMHIFGRWDMRQENAYKAVKAGDFSQDDLSVLWQPLKPFVYTQISKKNDSKLYMPLIKTGVQNKNSEYLLIMADALLRGAGVTGSPLSAIYEFMEESADRNEGKGIDTIQFESAVKAGLTGVVDINGLDYSGVKSALEKAAYKNGDVTKSYNEAVVHALPFDDYAIQQEIPSHFTGRQQQGSQDRILSIADMPDFDVTGAPNMITINTGDGQEELVTVKAAKERYYTAVVDNINNSKEELERRLGLNLVSKKLRNIALSELLRDEILKDNRYGSDLLWACSTNADGEFNVPLSDPIQAGRIQQLLNSIIKNTVYKQKVAGGPVVQVSSFGAKSRDQLHIKFKDSKGKILLDSKEFGEKKKAGEESIKSYDSFEDYLRQNQAQVAYFECFLSIYDESLIEDFGIRDSQGRFTGEIDVAAMEKSNPKLLQMIGYRIPTESKYSMVPIKVVGFLPRRAGEAIMMPAEITTFAGSDFDVDKLYVMRYAFNRRDTNRVSDSTLISNFARRLANTYQQRFADSYQDKETFRMEVESLLAGYPTDLSEKARNLINRSFEKFRKEVRQPSYTTIVTDSTDLNNNIMLDIHWAMLTSPLAADQFFTPGNFDEPKRIGYTIAVADNQKTANLESTYASKVYANLTGQNVSQLKNAAYKSKNILFPGTKVDFHRQNMVAAKLIGVFAQANVSHGFMGLHTDESGIQDVVINVPKNKGFTLVDTAGNTHRIMDDVPIDREYSWDNLRRQSAVLASLLAASVDAVKDPILNLMNINMTTVNVAVSLVRLGLDLESIAWFLSTPIIKDLTQRYNTRSTEGYVRIGDIIKEMQEELSKDQKLTFDANFGFDKNFFIEQHDEENNIPQYNYNLLELFNRTTKIADTFRNITHMTRYNSITSAVGPFASDTMVHKLQDNAFVSDDYITQSVKEAVNNPMLLAFRNTGYELEYQILGQRLVQASSFMQELVQFGQEVFGYMTQDLARKLTTFAMSYYMNMNTPIFDLSFENRSRMIDNFAEKEYLPLAQKYRDNLLIKNIDRTFEEVDPTTHEGNYNLELRTKGMLSERIEDIRAAWATLYQQEEERIETSKTPEKEENFALKLLEYNFFKSGLSYNPKTFTQLAPTVVKFGLPNYLDNLTRAEEGITAPTEEYNNLLVQFMLNSGITNLGKMYESDFTNLKQDSKDERKFSAQYKGKKRVPDSGLWGISLLESKDGDLQYVEINIGPKGKATLYVLDKLGGTNNDGFEIDPSTNYRQMRSVYKEVVTSNEAVPQESTTEGAFKANDEGEEEQLESLTAYDRILKADRLFFSERDDFKELLTSLANYGGLKPQTAPYIGRYKELLDLLNTGVSEKVIIETINKENLCS